MFRIDLCQVYLIKLSQIVLCVSSYSVLNAVLKRTLTRFCGVYKDVTKEILI